MSCTQVNERLMACEVSNADANKISENRDCLDMTVERTFSLLWGLEAVIIYKTISFSTAHIGDPRSNSLFFLLANTHSWT
jgi:hypothetical protein